LNHEIFRLLTATLPEADEATTAAVILDLVAWANADADTYTRRRAARLLTLMTECCPQPTNAHEALEALRSQHRDLRPPEDDGDGSPPTGEISSIPTTPEELHERLDNETTVIGELLIQYEAKRDHFDAHLWYRMSSLLRDAVRQWPEDGFKVLDQVGVAHAEIARYVIYGWAGAHLETDDAKRVLDRIETLDLAEVIDAVTRMLGGFRSTDDEDSTNWRAIPRSRKLAIVCWNTIPPDTPSALGGDDWFNRAINHPAGQLTEFWLQAIEHEWTANPDAWNGLPPDVAQHLEEMLGSNDIRAEMAQVLFASRIAFTHEADPPWSERNLLPLLNWDDVPRAARAWDGFLSHGGWTERLVNAGLLDLMFETVENSEYLTDNRRRRLLGQFASLAIGGDDDPQDWLHNFTMRATSTDRAEWAEQVAHHLRNSPTEIAERQWDRWMRTYWQNRLAGVPRGMTVEEATAMTEWTLYLTDSMLEGIPLALQHDLAPGEHTLILHVLAQDNRIARAPEQFARLVAHFLAGATKPFWAGYDLPTIIAQLRSAGVLEELIRPIEEQADRLDIPHN
jgi:hypothetical protein